MSHIVTHRRRRRRPTLVPCALALLLTWPALGAPAAFTIDPAASTFTLTGTFNGAPLQPQSAGSDTTGLTGTLAVDIDRAAGTLTSVASSYNVEFLLAGGTCLAIPANVAQNVNCTVDVVFAPVLAGARTGTVTILDNGTPNPLTIAVSGTGGAGAPAEGRLAGPASVGFGSQALFTQSAAKTVTLRNTGSLAVGVTALTSSNPSEFPLLASSCGIVAPGATCTASVAFVPAAAGTRAATLAIVNDGATNPLTVALSGSGAVQLGDQSLTLSAASGSFSGTLAGSTSSNLTPGHWSPTTSRIWLLNRGQGIETTWPDLRDC